MYSDKKILGHSFMLKRRPPLFYGGHARTYDPLFFIKGMQGFIKEGAEIFSLEAP